jgi:hypothetical protein
MLACNPFKASITAAMLMSDEQITVYKEVRDLFDTMPRNVRAAMDKDRAALEGLGVW